MKILVAIFLIINICTGANIITPALRHETVKIVKIDTISVIKQDTTRFLKYDTTKIMKTIKDTSIIIKYDTSVSSSKPIQIKR